MRQAAAGLTLIRSLLRHDPDPSIFLIPTDEGTHTFLHRAAGEMGPRIAVLAPGAQKPDGAHEWDPTLFCFADPTPLLDSPGHMRGLLSEMIVGTKVLPGPIIEARDGGRYGIVVYNFWDLESRGMGEYKLARHPIPPDAAEHIYDPYIQRLERTQRFIDGQADRKGG
jgi:hypothetical protein